MTAGPLSHARSRQAERDRRAGGDVVGTLVRIAFLVRLIALTFAVLGLVVGEPDLLAATLFCVLVVTSHLGLQRPSVRVAVVRHPALALPDVVVVSLVPLLVGVDSPLTLVAVSSALLIGVLFVPRTSAPLALLLCTTYVLAPGGAGTGWDFERFTFPVVLLSVAAIGLAFRRMAEQQRAVEAEGAAARAAAVAAQERLRLARDLHDTVAKSVQGIALTAASLPGWMERDPVVARKHALSVASGARAAVVAARGLLTSLRLDDPERPLEEVLEELACRWQADRGLDLDRDLEAVGELDPTRRHELVCAVSEALENVARHAPGSGVVLRLSDTGDGVRAAVVDDGPGFGPDREEEAVAAGHYGITGMRERLAAAGGSAVVRSAPGLGTQVHLHVPYRVDADPGRAVEEVVG